jgi:RsiW-degrading membrane proteinase PrsW (M82 family)
MIYYDYLGGNLPSGERDYQQDQVMMLAISVLSAIFPSLLLLWFFYSHDVNPAPGKVITITFGLGILIVAPVLALELSVFSDFVVANPYLAGLVKGFWGAALPEELLKFLVVAGYCMRHKALDERMDGMVYGAVASFYVGQARFDSKSRGRYLALGLGMAIILHGLYDFPLLTIRELNLGGQKLSFPEVMLVTGLSGLSMGVLLVEGALAIKLLRTLRMSQLRIKKRLEAQIRERLFKGHLEVK